MEKILKQIIDKLDNLDTKIDKLDSSQTRMENELIDKVRGLFDAREVQNDANARLQNSLDRIEAKIDILQLETASIRRVK